MRISLNRVLTATKKQDKDAFLHDRLFALCILRLYSPDDADMLTLYNEHHYKPQKLLQRALRGYRGEPDAIYPQDNETQRLLSTLVPTANKINLYIGTNRRNMPDASISLARMTEGRAKGLWVLSNARVRVFSGGNPPRDGIQAWWGDMTPPSAQHAATIPIKFQRIIRGARNSALMLDEVEGSYELRRQLTYWFRLTQAISPRRIDRVSVWHANAKGKAVFSVAPKIGEPFGFTGMGTRAGDSPGDKLRCLIYGDLPQDLFQDALGQQSRYFGVRIKGASHSNGLDPKTNAVIRELLMLQATPIVGLFTDDGTHLYGLHFEEDDIQPAYLSTAKVKQDEIPAIKAPDNRRYYLPNYALLGVLRETLLEKKPTGATCHEARLAYAFRTMGLFTNISGGWMAIADFFDKVGLPLDDGEKEILALVQGYR